VTTTTVKKATQTFVDPIPTCTRPVGRLRLQLPASTTPSTSNTTPTNAAFCFTHRHD
jgi:hypothetical protein